MLIMWMKLSTIPFLSGCRPTREGFVIVIDIIHSNFRHLKNPQSRMLSVILLLRMGRFCSDGTILQRIVPLLLLGLEDPIAHVRAASVRVLRSLLALVVAPSLLESNIFPLYIFPSLSRVAKDSELVVRVAFAECIGVFAETAKHFLDTAHVLSLSRVAADSVGMQQQQQSEGGGSMYLDFPYDQKLDFVREQFHRWIKELVVEGSAAGSLGSSLRSSSGVIAPAVLSSSSLLSSAADGRRASTLKRMFLTDIIRLCVFFGQESTMDKLLTQLLTFLNDPDWELR
jgi:phosphoinositide-3-kinase regulatory subunit 4